MSSVAIPESPAVESKPYNDLLVRLKHAGTVDSVRALLSWDQESLMPLKAADLRADHSRGSLDRRTN